MDDKSHLRSSAATGDDICDLLTAYAGSRSDGFAKLAVDAAAEIKRLRAAPQAVPVTAEVQKALATSLKAWDAYGGFDSREDTANKANAMAKAIRAYLAPHLSTGELK